MPPNPAQHQVHRGMTLGSQLPCPCRQAMVSAPVSAPRATGAACSTPSPGLGATCSSLSRRPLVAGTA
eukprot:9311543-Alexandrium_andersonii.AAC.1